MQRALLVMFLFAACSVVQASTSYTWTTSFLTDANQPASATAVLTYDPSSPNQLTLTLTDTTINPISDAPNLADFSFTLPTFTSISDATAFGQTISSIVFNHNPAGTLGNYSGNSPWTATTANNGWWGGYQAYDIYAPQVNTGCTPGPQCNTAPHSIVGAPSANGEYVESGNPSIGSANLLNSTADRTMFYQSATFVLTFSSNLTTAQINGLASSVVKFGFGPDGINTPDTDDISAGVYQGATATPEPASLMLTAGGLGLAALLRRRCWK